MSKLKVSLRLFIKFDFYVLKIVHTFL